MCHDTGIHYLPQLSQGKLVQLSGCQSLGCFMGRLLSQSHRPAVSRSFPPQPTSVRC